MNFSVTDFLNFLDKNEFIIEHRKVGFAPVEQIRKSLRTIAVSLDTEDDHQYKLFRDMFGIITTLQVSPLKFDNLFHSKISNLFSENIDIGSIWGTEIKDNLSRVKIISQSLIGEENPLIKEIINITKKELLLKKRIKFCLASRDADDFILIMSNNQILVSRDDIICSPKEYSDQGLFDTLIRIGPLLSWGRSSCPNGIINSPKYTKLFQVTWSDSSNEDNFGDDALVKFERSTTSLNSKVVNWKLVSEEINYSWSKAIPDFKSSTIEVPTDDFKVFRRENNDFKNARLVKLDETYGILFSQNNKVIVFDSTAATDEKVYTCHARDIHINNFVVIPKQVSQLALSVTSLSSGDRTSKWKTELKKQLLTRPNELCAELQIDGLSLVSLNHQIRHWANDPTTVIHAPQKYEHFSILCSKLGLNMKLKTIKGNEVEFSKVAWEDIRISRGEAISAGFEKNEALDSHIVTELNKMSEDFNDILKSGINRFNHKINPSNNFEEIGVVFYKIIGEEEGYKVPIKELNKILEIDYIKQWQQ
jgi:hypothetical protein